MSTRREPDAPAVAVVAGRWSGFRRWAARRARQLLRVFLALLCVLGLIGAAALLWRGTCLIGLPDVGDPFDVTAVYSETIPDDRNAFVFFRQAVDRLRPPTDVPRAVLNKGPAVGWSKADPRVRGWAESNRESLDLFRRGAEQSDGRAHPGEDESTFTCKRLHVKFIVLLALLEASRLEERDDMPGAWAWYRAVLKMRAHLMRWGNGYDRWQANLTGGWLQGRCALWAADPGTRAVDLRRALDDVTALQPRAEWEASAIRVDYLLAKRELELPERFLYRGDGDEQNYEIAGEPLPPNVLRTVYAIRRFLLREPERSRRVLRLAFANWLAHVEVPEERRRRPAVRAVLDRNSVNPGVYFYQSGPAAPAAARALPPQALAEWLVTAPDATLIQGQWLWSSLGVDERRQYRALQLMLAEELYRREHGRPPATENDLIGTYLKCLPDDGFADLDTETPTVGFPRASAPDALRGGERR